MESDADNQLKFFPSDAVLGAAPRVLLREVNRQAFHYPFFNEGVYRALKDTRKKVMDLSKVPEIENPLNIKGFIFHASHCGSTLLARMMMTLPRVRVVAETEAINGILLSYLFYDLPREQVLLQLKAIIECFREPFDDEDALIFKTTSWNIFFIDLFQELYPDVPWIYVDRDTNEVVESNLKEDAGFVQWWDFPTDLPRKYFFDPDEKLADKRTYVRRMIERKREHARQCGKGNGALFQYPDFIKEFPSKIAPHFNLDCTQAEIQEAMGVTKYNSKSYEPQLFDKVTTK